MTYLKDATSHMSNKYPSVKLPYSTSMLNEYC